MKSMIFKWFLSTLIISMPVAGISQRNQFEALAQVMSNTYNIYGDKLTGTAFMIVRGGQQYLITAAHLFQASDKSGGEVKIQLVLNNQLQQMNAKVFFHSNRKVDLAVLKPDQNITQNLQFPEDKEQFRDQMNNFFSFKGVSTDSVFSFAGMDAYFLGFPLGNLGTEFLGVKFPLVKKAMVSGWLTNEDVHLMVLDGHNNLGFSGGPIVIYDSASKKMNLAGIVSGYLPELVNGVHKNGVLSVSENSGIIICVESYYIEEIFDKNKAIKN